MKHFVILTKFKGIADQPNFEEEDNRFLAMSIALKCAGKTFSLVIDISFSQILDMEQKNYNCIKDGADE